MYTKFNYSPSGYFYNSEINRHFTKGIELFSAHEKEVQDCLSEYITEDGIINGTALKEHWFSISKKDVFISHSHCDINKVKAFAGWLYDCFGLEAFIDSCSWGYCDDLLKKIDKKYCYKPKTDTYDYQLRNYTTSHVHMMLSTALTEMMDNTECIIFFNTPNSINISEEIDKIKQEKGKTTVSPWIYHELSMTTMLRQKKTNRIEKVVEHFAQDSLAQLTIEYDVNKALEGMSTLTDEQLREWFEKWNRCPEQLRFSEAALDILYNIVFPIKNRSL